MSAAPAQPWQHHPVMLAEAVEAILAAPALMEGAQSGSAVVVDGTFGRGGHSRALLARLPAAARLIAVDKDPQAIEAAAAIGDERFAIEHAGFADLPALLARRGVQRIAALLLDLGVSSPQIDDPARGFSFRHDAPLDMRMDVTRGETAAAYLERASEREIAEVIREYGEERFAAQIAKALVARRQGGLPVRRTGELAELVARAVKTREPGQDPATRTFQALRICINAELEELEQALSAAPDLLAPGGRLAVISFHSLEDRIVKRFIAHESTPSFDRRVPFAPPAPLRFKAIGRIKPGADEVAANPRARSAVLRVAERLPGAAA